jgi:acyl-CoA synthetase (AMP-forming)/AMP-acid ligase II
MKSADALLGAWEKIVGQTADRPAIIADSGKILQTFAGIESRAREFEAQLDFAASNVIAIQIGNHPDWPAILLACLRRGLVALPLDESMTDERRNGVFHMCGVVAAAMQVGSTSGGRGVEILPIGTSAATTQKWGDNPPSLLKITSGTTAAPRAIRFRSEQLLADCEQICDTMGISDADLNFGVIPISHSYGFSNLLTPLIVRGVPIAVSNDRTPRAVLEGLANTKATVLPATPVFYQAFCKIENTPKLPNLRLCISAGAPLPATTAREFREKFQLAIHSFYGASECGGICYDREGTAESEGFVGPPMKDVELDPIDSIAGPTQLRVRSAAAGDGYFPNSNPEKLGNGAFVPDDLLERAGAGFKIVGRVSELINVAGKKVNPAEIEAHLRRCPGVREAVVFGRKSDRRNEEIAACVVADPGVVEQNVLEFARKGLSGWQVPKRLFFVGEIPTSERGKISRRELAQRYSN